jgi:hypothetical protein
MYAKRIDECNLGKIELISWWRAFLQKLSFQLIDKYPGFMEAEVFQA